MSESPAVKILKSAILLESRGKAFYQNVARNTQDPEVREFFQLMVTEEERHEEILMTQLKAVSKGDSFRPEAYQNEETSEVAKAVLSKKIVQKISGAGFEAAAISAAMSMEQEAVRLYSQRRDATDDPVERELYTWLTKWEQVHLRELSEMDRELRESVWNDSDFFPY